ncbi:glycosyltransferase [Hyphobacterium sp.]|uniref:glycosyltransferase n=1 Tax=Hyphobacterium sp. TaxID=2004662 RepID=UPI00374A5E1F
MRKEGSDRLGPNESTSATSQVPTPSEIAENIRYVYRLTVLRDATDEELAIWINNFANGVRFQQFLKLMCESDEAKSKQAEQQLAFEMSDGEFVLALYEIVSARGCNGYELEANRGRLASGAISRTKLLAEFFQGELRNAAARADEMVHDGLSCNIMGTGTFISHDEWFARAKNADELKAARSQLAPSKPFVLTGAANIEITCIASLYKGGDFIERFMENITSQTCFDRYCELVIVDADSDENEAETITRYMKDHPSVRYRRMDSRVGIYEAWNIGVEMARGQYLTNTNLDDVRRRDSIEIQAGTLQALPFVDVVYQDFYYSFDPHLDWEDVAAFGWKSELPIATPHNMMRFNSPHNAPMWRKALHDELGLFDASLQSAGDYEFWLRCFAAGKKFYKVNEPHVVYYQNPNGLSTRSDTRGIVEGKAVTKKYSKSLMSDFFLMPIDDFVAELRSADIPSSIVASNDRHVIAQSGLRNLARHFKKAIS